MVENRGRERANAIDPKQELLGALTKTYQHRREAISRYSGCFCADFRARLFVLLTEELPGELFGFGSRTVLGITGRYCHPHGIERVAIEKRGGRGDQGKNEDERAYDEVCTR